MSEEASFKIKKYEDLDKIMWNDFLLKCKNYHFMFNRDFMEYHSDRFKDFSLIFKNDKHKIIALLPGNIKDKIFYSILSDNLVFYNPEKYAELIKKCHK